MDAVKKYRKKTAEVEAIQVSWENLPALIDLLPEGKGAIIASPGRVSARVITPEGDRSALPGYFIVRDFEGDFWVYDPGAFAKGFEGADERDEVEVLSSTIDALVGIFKTHYDGQVARNRKFGREGSDCACEMCRAMQVIEKTLGEQS